ncbi:MAG TPA: hypothetical protein VFX76_15655, partial [Roseiflexaceae bacterium]|nr:hypothetical protein [Roseiflexaceae bacterium]
MATIQFSDTAPTTQELASGGCCDDSCCGGAAVAQTDITTAVRNRYGAIAEKVLADQASSGCCGDDCCGSSGDGITKDLYMADELEGLPLKAALASLG